MMIVVCGGGLVRRVEGAAENVCRVRRCVTARVTCHHGSASHDHLIVRYNEEVPGSTVVQRVRCSYSKKPRVVQSATTFSLLGSSSLCTCLKNQKKQCEREIVILRNNNALVALHCQSML